jgi:hypothetical protein
MGSSGSPIMNMETKLRVPKKGVYNIKIWAIISFSKKDFWLVKLRERL